MADEDYCDLLLEHISRDIKEIQAEQCDLTSYAGEVTIRNRKANSLCEHLDMVLRHKLMSPSIGYWKYVSQFTRSDIIKEIRQLPKVKTDLGRGRAWLFTALNEQSLEAYFRNFQDNRNLMEKFYKIGALVRNKEKLLLLQTLLSGLEYVVFNLTLDFEYLDMATCDPSTSTKIKKHLYSLREPQPLPIAQPLEKVEPPVPAAEDTVPVTTPDREKPSTQTTVPAIRGLHPQHLKPPTDLMPTAEEEKETSVDRSDSLLQSSSKESSLTISSSLTLEQNAALEVSSEARIFGSERSQILSTPNDLDEFNAISLRSRPKEKKGLAKKTKKTKPSATQPTRVASTSSVEGSSSAHIQESETKSSADHLKSNLNPFHPEGSCSINSTNPTSGKPSEKDMAHSSSRSPSEKADSPVLKGQPVQSQPNHPHSPVKSMSPEHQTKVGADRSSLLNLLVDEMTPEIAEATKKNAPAKKLYGEEIPPNKRVSPSRESTDGHNERLRSPPDIKSTQRPTQDLLSFGIPERPLAVSKEDKFATEVNISQKNKLLISLNVCFDSSETLHKLLQVYKFSGKALLQVCYILITNDALYILEDSEGEAGYSRIAGSRFQDLEDTQVGLNWQSLTFVFGKPPQYHMIVTCDEALSRGIVECLTEMTVRHPKIRQPFGMSKGDRFRWKALQLILPLQDESDVQLYSIAYWEQLEGDMPPPCSSPPPELEESCETQPPLIQGTLHVKTNKFGVPFWKPSFLVLRTDALLQYNSETDQSVKLKYPIQSNNFGGCKRLPKENRPNAFMVTLGGVEFVFAGKSEEEVTKWIQVICEAAITKVSSVVTLGGRYGVLLTDDKIHILQEDWKAQKIEQLSCCQLEDIEYIGWDPELSLYCVVSYDNAESESGASGSWLFCFSSSFELGKFERTVAQLWEEKMKVQLEFDTIHSENLKRRAEKAVELLKASRTRSDSVTKGRNFIKPKI